MRMPMCCAAVLACVVIGHPPPAIAQVDQQRAQEFFKEAQAVCERDGGRLWGEPICMPMVIGDAQTQTFATSQPPPDAPRPKIIGLLNGPIRWGDTRWAALRWDMVAPQPPRVRSGMLIHESFHIVQMRLGLSVETDSAEHLDSVDGRYWMRLEWRALARALRESGEPRALAIREALAFRQARHARFPDKVPFTFWTYWRNRYARDAGLRIDHFLLSDDLAGMLADAGVDRDVRGLPGASDHAPAWITLDLPAA